MANHLETFKRDMVYQQFDENFCFNRFEVLTFRSMINIPKSNHLPIVTDDLMFSQSRPGHIPSDISSRIPSRRHFALAINVKAFGVSLEKIIYEPGILSCFRQFCFQFGQQIILPLFSQKAIGKKGNIKPLIITRQTSFSHQHVDMRIEFKITAKRMDIESQKLWLEIAEAEIAEAKAKKEIMAAKGTLVRVGLQLADLRQRLANVTGQTAMRGSAQHQVQETVAVASGSIGELVEAPASSGHAGYSIASSPGYSEGGTDKGTDEGHLTPAAIRAFERDLVRHLRRGHHIEHAGSLPMARGAWVSLCNMAKHLGMEWDVLEHHWPAVRKEAGQRIEVYSDGAVTWVRANPAWQRAARRQQFN